MALFDFLRRKEVNSEQLSEYFATSVKSPKTSPIGRRPTMSELCVPIRYACSSLRSDQCKHGCKYYSTPICIGKPANASEGGGTQPKTVEPTY